MQTSRRLIAAATLIAAVVVSIAGWYWWTPGEQTGVIEMQPIKAHRS